MPSRGGARSFTSSPQQAIADIFCVEPGTLPRSVAGVLTVYTLSNCDRCRAATKWLRARGVAFCERAIRETPPSKSEIRTMLAALGDKRKVFNVTGREYREQKLGDRIDAMTSEQAIELLASNGSLVKRPFLIGDRVALVGFDEKVWAEAVAKR